MGAALETVTVQHERAKEPRQVRISGNIRRAIEFMVHEGQKRSIAAQNAGITDDALRKAMLKPEVLAFLNDQQRVLRTSARARSIARIDQLADDAESEHVKLQSNVFLLGIEGIAAVQRTENTHNLNVQVPGLCIMIAPRMGEQLIHNQENQVGSANAINALPAPVPHPSLRNAIETTYSEVPATTPGAPGRGEKS